jgi:hypothetical protein
MSSSIELEIPGSFTLEQIMFGLIETEALRNRNVTAMSMLPDDDEGNHRNTATLVKQPIGVPFPTLLLVAFTGDAPDPVAGKALLFTSTLWVEDEETKVAAFR